jgi:hypothetical protein
MTFPAIIVQNMEKKSRLKTKMYVFSHGYSTYYSERAPLPETHSNINTESAEIA